MCAYPPLEMLGRECPDQRIPTTDREPCSTRPLEKPSNVRPPCLLIECCTWSALCWIGRPCRLNVTAVGENVTIVSCLWGVSSCSLPLMTFLLQYLVLCPFFQRLEMEAMLHTCQHRRRNMESPQEVTVRFCSFHE